MRSLIWARCEIADVAELRRRNCEGLTPRLRRVGDRDEGAPLHLRGGDGRDRLRVRVHELVARGANRLRRRKDSARIDFHLRCNWCAPRRKNQFMIINFTIDAERRDETLD